MRIIAQLDMNMTSGQRVNPVKIDTAETSAANLVNILLKFTFPPVNTNILIADVLN
jgi:hypothetical protein